MSLIHTSPGQNPEPGPAYLESTRFFDWKTESVRRFAEKVIMGETTDIGRAVKLFYAVRDGIRYDPFSMRLDPGIYVASQVLAAKSARARSATRFVAKSRRKASASRATRSCSPALA